MMRTTMSMATALAVFRTIYVAFILTASLTTLIGLKAPVHHAHEAASHLAILAGVEIFAALLFLFRRSEIWACAILLAVYAVATAMSVAFGDWSLRFVYYGATAVFIVIAARNKSGDVAHRLQRG